MSEAAAKRAALSDTIQHPLTLLPTVAGVLAGIGLPVLTTVSIPVGAGIGLLGIFVGGLHWAFRYFAGGDACMQKFYAERHEEFQKLKEAKAEQLAADLKKKGCKRGQVQVGQLDEKFQNLVEVFGRVLSPSELTYSRFVGTAEQVYTSGLENLERIVVLLTNIDDIDRDEVGDQITALTGKKPRNVADERNLTAFKRQAGVFDSTEQEVQELLAQNEEALATMDETGQAALRLKDRSASLSPKETMEEAMRLLGDMVARAKRSNIPAVTLDAAVGDGVKK
jgi:hypothetical protein